MLTEKSNNDLHMLMYKSKNIKQLQLKKRKTNLNIKFLKLYKKVKLIYA